MNKQVEEIARTMCAFYGTEKCYDCRYCCDCHIEKEANRLYNAGYRKQIEAENMAIYPTSAFECSLCGWSNWDLATGDGTYKFCPNCGARMSGGKSD